MNDHGRNAKSGVSRRELIRLLGASGVGVTLGGALSGGPARADVMGRGAPATVVGGRVIQPQREVPVLHETDVLVVGAGPAGTVAALAARRAGAKVTLVERYGHFGGLWTGGLVVLVIGHWVTGQKQVCLGIGEEMMQRLDKLDRGIVDRRQGVNPTVDAEALKYVMVEMITEAGIDVFLHCWGVDAIVEGNKVLGAVFECKSGRQAILARDTVDASGDGDILGAAGAEHDHRRYHVGLVHRIGNLDKVDRSAARPKDGGEQGTDEGQKLTNLGGRTPIAGVNWVNMQGPDADGLDVRELTRLELGHRKRIWQSVERIRSTPGYEQVYLVETAPQIGVRITRILKGTETLTMDGVMSNKTFPDVVAVGGAWRGEHQEWEIPYGALLPVRVDHVLAAGRCISCEPKMHDLIRVIPNCFVSGQAAGVAAAVAAQDGCTPREVEIPKVQRILREQGAYLG
jgi:hypothetical protein